MIGKIVSGMKGAFTPQSIGFAIVFFAALAVLSAFNYGTEDASAALQARGVGA